MGVSKVYFYFSEKVKSELLDHGISIHPYDPYVVKKRVRRIQMTVTWHVDNLKISTRTQKL